MNLPQEATVLRSLRAACAGFLLVVAACSSPGTSAPTAPRPRGDCAAIAALNIPHAQIDTVTSVNAGETQEIGGYGIPPLPVSAGYCRVNATLSPVEGSRIGVELWLPVDWNGKLVAVGNGGFGGGLVGPRVGMRRPVAQGYATVGTDMGHPGDPSGEDATWALNNPVALQDFAHRAIHETNVFARAVIAAHYGAPARRAYFEGCSDGGREGLMAAQRYPDDFDGVIAMAPAYAWPELMSGFMRMQQEMASVPNGTLSAEALQLVQSEALAQCDAIDGVRDGVVENPRQCNFDPSRLLCRAGRSSECLTRAQIDVLRTIYAGPRHPATGASVFPGFAAGGEATPNEWDGWIVGPRQSTFGAGFFRNFVYNDLNWNPATFTYDRELAAARERVGFISADSTDLSAFEQSGGKLILLHGWHDAAIPAQNTINYYEALQREMGDVSSFARLYMVPGLGHCFGGPGPSAVATLDALDQWVEHDAAPQALTASRFESDFTYMVDLPTGPPVRTRPLCPYPQTARYRGAGSTDDAANFSCEAN